MLKISFLVTFCGLLARMAQAQSLPCNQIPVILTTPTLNNAVAQGVPQNKIAPNPTPVNDQTTGAEYTNLKPRGTTDVSCKVNTQGNDGPITVAVSGQTQYIGQFKSLGSVKDVNCDVANTVTVPLTVGVSSEGDVICEGPKSIDEAKVTSTIKRAPGGLISDLLGAVLDLLNRLLTALGNTLERLVKSTLTECVKSIEDSLNSYLKKVTDEKPIGNNQTCKQKVTTVKTSSNNCLTMVMESNRYSPSGELIPPPAEYYTPPVITPDPDTGCKYAIPAQWINHALASTPTTQYQVTGAALNSLSTEIQGHCGNGISLEELVLSPTGNHQVVITENKVTSTLSGNLVVIATGSPSTFWRATVTIRFIGTFKYVNPCVMLSLTADSIGTAKLVNGPSCDVTSLVSKAFIDEVKGKPTNTCVELSPAAKLDLQGPVDITPSNGYVICDHKV